MDPAEYCQQKAAASGSSFYYSFLFLPAEQRQAITALYALCREVDDAVDECSDPNVARMKLQWWREELERAFRGTAQHPVTQALSPHLRTYDLALESLQEIIDGMEMDLEPEAYARFSDLALYCHRAAGIVGQLSAEIFGYEDRRTLKYAHALGMAFQLTNIIRDVREDAQRGRVYIPQDELAQYDVGFNDLLQPPTPDRVQALMAAQAQRARAHYRQAFEHLPERDRYRQRSGLIMAAIYETLLDEMEREGFRVLEGRIALTPLRKLWIAWTTDRRERRRARKRRAVADTADAS